MFEKLEIESLVRARRPGHGLPQAFYNHPDAFAFDLQAVRRVVLEPGDLERRVEISDDLAQVDRHPRVVSLVRRPDSRGAVRAHRGP